MNTPNGQGRSRRSGCGKVQDIGRPDRKAFVPCGDGTQGQIRQTVFLLSRSRCADPIIALELDTIIRHMLVHYLVSKECIIALQRLLTGNDRVFRDLWWLGSPCGSCCRPSSRGGPARADSWALMATCHSVRPTSLASCLYLPGQSSSVRQELSAEKCHV